MVYGHPPSQHLSVFQKMKAFPDLTHTIDFPKHSTPSIPTRSSGQTTVTPKRLDHLKRRVRGDVIMSMKSCLCRNPKERAAIPELLDQDWLAMKECELLVFFVLTSCVLCLLIFLLVSSGTTCSQAGIGARRDGH